MRSTDAPPQSERKQERTDRRQSETNGGAQAKKEWGNAQRRPLQRLFADRGLITELSHGHNTSLVDSARVRLVDCGVWTCGVTNQCATVAPWRQNLVHEPGARRLTGAASFRDTTATHTQTHMYDNQGPLLHRTKRGSVRVTEARARARARAARVTAEADPGPGVAGSGFDRQGLLRPRGAPGSPPKASVS